MIVKPFPNEWAARRIKDSVPLHPGPDAVRESRGACLRPSNPLRYNHSPSAPVATRVPAVNYLRGLTMRGRCTVVPMRHVTPFTGNTYPMRVTLPKRRLVIPIPRLGLKAVPIDEG